jgi:hypothetical protein
MPSKAAFHGIVIYLITMCSTQVQLPSCQACSGSSSEAFGIEADEMNLMQTQLQMQQHKRSQEGKANATRIIPNELLEAYLGEHSSADVAALTVQSFKKPAVVKISYS